MIIKRRSVAYLVPFAMETDEVLAYLVARHGSIRLIKLIKSKIWPEITSKALEIKIQKITHTPNFSLCMCVFTFVLTLFLKREI